MLSYYDKLKKEDVEVALPFTFLVLDQLNTIAGFNDDQKASFYANEVRDITTEKLRVRCGKSDFKTGLYKDVKASVSAEGGKYAKSCYIAYKEEDGSMSIGNILFMGASFGGGNHYTGDAKKKVGEVIVPGWMDFCKTAGNQAIEQKAVIIDKDDRLCTNGAVKFYCPKFVIKEVGEATAEEATKLDAILQEYITAYLKRNQEALGAAAVENTAAEPVHANQANPPVFSNNRAPEDKLEADNSKPWSPNIEDELPF